MDKSQTLHIISKNVKCCTDYEEMYGVSSKIENRISIWASNPTSDYTAKIIEFRISKIYLCFHVPYRIIHKSQDVGTRISSSL
jgi:hypothetical protein